MSPSWRYLSGPGAYGPSLAMCRSPSLRPRSSSRSSWHSARESSSRSCSTPVCSPSQQRDGHDPSGRPCRSAWLPSQRPCWWQWSRIRWRSPPASGSSPSHSSGPSARQSLARNASCSSSSAHGVSSPGRRCWTSADGSPVTSTTSSDMAWRPSCFRSRVPATCYAAIPNECPPRATPRFRSSGGGAGVRRGGGSAQHAGAASHGGAPSKCRRGRYGAPGAYCQ